VLPYTRATVSAFVKPCSTVSAFTPSAPSALIDSEYRWGEKTVLGSSTSGGGGVGSIAAADQITAGSQKTMWANPPRSDRSAARIAAIARL
jgi:hypothetical protein